MGKKKSIREFTAYSDDPFEEAVALKIMKFNKRKLLRKYKGNIIDPATGEFVEGLMSIDEQDYDGEVFTKTFVSAIKDHLDLSGRATALFQQITLELEQDKRLMMLYSRDIMNKLQISEKTFYLALQELLEEEVIARHDKPNMFYINSKYIYNGDRLVIVKSYVRRKEKEQLRDKKAVEETASMIPDALNNFNIKQDGKEEEETK